MKPNLKSGMQFGENLMACEMGRIEIVMNKLGPKTPEEWKKPKRPGFYILGNQVFLVFSVFLAF